MRCSSHQRIRHTPRLFVAGEDTDPPADEESRPRKHVVSILGARTMNQNDNGDLAGLRWTDECAGQPDVTAGEADVFVRLDLDPPGRAGAASPRRHLSDTTFPMLPR